MSESFTVHARTVSQTPGAQRSGKNSKKQFNRKVRSSSTENLEAVQQKTEKQSNRKLEAVQQKTEKQFKSQGAVQRRVEFELREGCSSRRQF
jgi:hypothetical protein